MTQDTQEVLGETPESDRILTVRDLHTYFHTASGIAKAVDGVSFTLDRGKTLGIVGEYYWIARERGTIEAARNRASFPLRYTQAGERHEVAVRIRRTTAGGLGAARVIDKVEEPEQ